MDVQPQYRFDVTVVTIQEPRGVAQQVFMAEVSPRAQA
jgi:hypothetical protein